MVGPPLTLPSPTKFSRPCALFFTHVLYVKNPKLAPRIPKDEHNQLRVCGRWGGHKIVNRGRAWLGAVLCRPESKCGRFVQVPHTRRKRALVCSVLRWLSWADVEFGHRQCCLLSLVALCAPVNESHQWKGGGETETNARLCFRSRSHNNMSLSHVRVHTFCMCVMSVCPWRRGA